MLKSAAFSTACAPLLLNRKWKASTAGCARNIRTWQSSRRRGLKKCMRTGTDWKTWQMLGKLTVFIMPLSGAQMVESLNLRLKRSRVRFPAVPLLDNDIGRVVHTRVPLSQSSRIWYRLQGSKTCPRGSVG